MQKLESCIKANKQRHYTGVGVLIITKYLNKPCVVLGLERNKSKSLSEKLAHILNNENKNQYHNDTNVNVKCSSNSSVINADNLQTVNTDTTTHTNLNNQSTKSTDIDSKIINRNSNTDTIININDDTDGNTETIVTPKKYGNRKGKGKGNRVYTTDDEKNKLNKKDKKYINIYEEFGGGIQDNNLSLEENACFELCEETSNLLNFTNPYILNKGMNTYFDIPYLKDRLYRLYVIYLDDFTKDIHLFYKNKRLLKCNASTYFKYRSFTEVSDITFLELDNIYKYIDNYHNYIAINSDEMLYNQINKDKGINKYKGILKCVDNIYLSKRVVDFLNMNFIYDKKSKGYIYYNDTIDDITNKEMYNKFNKTVKNYKPYTIRGLDFCKYMYKNINYTDSTSYINLTKPRKNNKASVKYTFLNHTYSVDAF